jgi:hypothetical protein
LPSKYSSTHLYLFTGRAFPLLVCWSSDGNLTFFLLHNRQFNAVVYIPSSASCARLRPIPRKSRLRHPLCVGSIEDVLAATSTVHHSSTQRLPPALPPRPRRHFLFFITPAPMYVRHGRWHSNFVWHPGSECRTQPTVISNPSNAFLFLCFTPAQQLGFSQTAPLQWCLSSVYSPADIAFRPRNAEPAGLHFLTSLSLHPRFTAAHCPARPAVCIARSCYFSRVILLSMAAPSRCISPPQITLPHAAHGTDSSCRG